MEEQVGILRNGNHSSDHSAALAEKLLQGWALLQEHCPQCFTPLVRNRARKMYCVACAQWVVSENEAAEQRARERDGSESKGDPTPASLPTAEPSSYPVASSDNVNGRGQQQLAQSSRPSISFPETLDRGHDREQPSKGGTTSSTRVIPKLEYSGRTLEQLLPNISYTVTHKIEEIGNALKETHDIEEMRSLMKVLREGLQTMDAIINTASLYKQVL